MSRYRRTSSEVISDLITKLTALEAEKSELEEQLKTATNPLSIALAAKIWVIADAIARVVKAIRGFRRKRRKK